MVDIDDKQDAAAELGAQRFRLEGKAWIGPATHLAAERSRLAGLSWERFDARQVGATLGAEITGLDLSSDLDDAVVDELRRALNEFKVLFFRDQPLDAGQQVALARRFGELEIHPFSKGNDDHPELVRFAKSNAVAGYENHWHHDVTWRAEPSLGAILRAVEVPPVGGDTLFADMAAAYDGLEPELADRIDGLAAVHDFMYAFGHNVPDELKDDMRAQYPEVIHPVVRVHPETGRKCLFVNQLFTMRIVGMDETESTELLNLLARESDQAEYQVRFNWEPNSIAFWDNRAVQHYASSDYWPDVRVMERASICGDRPRGTAAYEATRAA